MGALIAMGARALGISPLAAAVGLVLVALGAAWGAHAWVASSALSAAREAGAAGERAAWEALVAQERERQADINARLTEQARLEAARLRVERDDLAARLEDLSHAADLDPDHDRLSLSAAGVRRLDAIR